MAEHVKKAEKAPNRTMGRRKAKETKSSWRNEEYSKFIALMKTLAKAEARNRDETPDVHRHAMQANPPGSHQLSLLGQT